MGQYFTYSGGLYRNKSKYEYQILHILLTSLSNYKITLFLCRTEVYFRTKENGDRIKSPFSNSEVINLLSQNCTRQTTRRPFFVGRIF